MDESLQIIEKGAVSVDEGNVIETGNEAEITKKYTSDRIIKLNDSAIMPGLINTHTHAAMVYFRGIADDLPLNEWLNNHIWPAENKWLGKEFIKDAIELACLEMLKGGITTFNDMYFFNDHAAESCKHLGMRAVLGSGILDFPSVSAKTTEEYLENAIHFIDKWKDDELITPCIAPHAVYTCGPDTLKKSMEIAEKLDVPVHIHLSETEWEVGEILSRYRKRPVEYLAELGFLNERVLAAHCIWLHDNEIDLLAKNKVGVSHCMESNLKLASGFAPVATMLSSGIKVTFGTDGAASNNDLNIFSEMSTTAKVHKALSNNPTILDAKTVVLMATRWGAEVLGLGEKIGSLEPGKSADLIALNLKKPHLTPIYNIYSHIVYAAMASDVEFVMVNGKIVIEGRKPVNADEDEILFKAKKWGERIKNV
ncbi:MAG: amidohydrolase family protein [Nitrospirae bacterium]|jgi:5-methylthioadenosine/S-adenosylhomocysteine deaminase|nr:amidohydrolase family protein [Nitrospirota bacterium]